MGRYQNLVFFDKHGNPCNFEYDAVNQKFTGTMYFPKVSTGLYEVLHILILEKFIRTNNKFIYGTPHIDDASLVTTSTESAFKLTWADDNTTDIFMFSFDKTDDPPIFTKYDELNNNVDYDINEFYPTGSTYKSTTVISSEALTINIALMSQYESNYRRQLIISDVTTDNIIAEIDFYGETVDEDYRLKVLCENMGYNIQQDDVVIFKNSDIEETEPDNILLNNKRKEILMEGNNIYPYIGSYKGLVNAIKYYGYDNLVIKEYWKNVNIKSSKFGKYMHTKVIDIFDPDATLSYDVNIPSKEYKKTSMFGLFYRINNIKENYFDEYDIPLTEEAFDFSLDEALIKLYGLKKKLKDKFLPFNARIVDIVGEADYFTKKSVRINKNRNVRLNIDVGIHPDFTVSPSTTGYIADLRALEDLLTPQTGLTSLSHAIDLSDDTINISEIADVFIAYFERYYPALNSISMLPDKEKIPAGYPIVLSDQSFTIKFEDINATWDSLNTSANYIFDFQPSGSINIGDIYKIQDEISGESIEYTVQSGDTVQLICEGLKTLWLAETGIPWTKFYLSVELTSNGYVLRIKGIEIATYAVKTNFQPSVIPYIFNTGEFEREEITISGLYTWDHINRSNFYQIEWTISKPKDINPAYYCNIIGDIQDYEDLPLILPYIGSYTVDMRLYDTFNNVSSKIKRDYITVESKEVEFHGFYRKVDDFSWNAYSDSLWKNMGSMWDIPFSNTLTLDNTHLTWDELNIAALLPNQNINPKTWIQNYMINGSISYPGPYYWSNLNEVTWNESTGIWWNLLDISGDTPAGFSMKFVQDDGSLTIDITNNVGQGTCVLPNTLSNAEQIVKLLTESEDPIISMYVYSLISDTYMKHEYGSELCVNSSYPGQTDWLDTDENGVPDGYLYTNINGVYPYMYTPTIQTGTALNHRYIDIVYSDDNHRNFFMHSLNTAVTISTAYRVTLRYRSSCVFSFTVDDIPQFDIPISTRTKLQTFDFVSDQSGYIGFYKTLTTNDHIHIGELSIKEVTLNPQSATDYILASGKNFGKNYDILELNYDSHRYTDVYIYDSISRNPTFSDVKLISDAVTIPPLTHVTLTWGNCKIPGKTEAKWIVENTTNTNFDTLEINKERFNYLFTLPGKYNVKLLLKDSNGNTNETIKNILIIE